MGNILLTGLGTENKGGNPDLSQLPSLLHRLSVLTYLGGTIVQLVKSNKISVLEICILCSRILEQSTEHGNELQIRCGRHVVVST